MHALIDDDLVRARGQLVGGPAIPADLQDLPNRRLRFDGEAVVDAATYGTFYVDERGRRHITDGAGRQELACSWDAPLVLEEGTWRVVTALEIAKATKTAAVNALRDEILTGGYQHNFGGSAGYRRLDNRNPSDRDNWQDLMRRVERMIAADEGAELVGVRDAGNETFTASAETVRTALIAMEDWGMAVLAHSWGLKDAIEAAASQAQLNAIDVSSDWPGSA